jgi:uncharacterized cofD-like protein
MLFYLDDIWTTPRARAILKKEMEHFTNPLRIVSIGGGNGLSTLLRGLKRYVKHSGGSVELTAIVTVTDDGGSSGRLRRDFDVLPPGDIRNCMVALAPDEGLFSRLFQYRFASGRGLKGHSFGNLFLMAMTHLTGDFQTAITLASEVLKVSGRIYPSTIANVTLEATLTDGRILAGESKISKSRVPIERVDLRPRKAPPMPEALQAIAEADLITLGPGSLFTSVIPNLLVDGMSEAIAASPAVKVYFMNLMSQPGETMNFRASDHVAALLRHGGRQTRPVVDHCVVNTRAFSKAALARYRQMQAKPVENDVDMLRRMGISVVEADLLRMAGRTVSDKIRHDPGALAAIAIELAQEARRSRNTKPRTPPAQSSKNKPLKAKPRKPKL